MSPLRPRRIALAYDDTLQSCPGEAPTHDDIRSTVGAVARALEARGHEVVWMPVTSPRSVHAALARLAPDVVFNLVEGLEADSFAEAEVARELERAGAAFTGCQAGAIELCLHKARCKEFLAGWGLPVPRGRVMDTPCPADGLRFPLIVKCLHEDASVGLTDRSVVRTEAELHEQVAEVVRKFEQPAMVEEFLEGREFNVAIAGPRPTALPISEIDFSTMPAGKPRFVSYDAKWVPESVEYRSTVPVCPAEISGPAAARLRRLALRAFRLTGCRDVARVDFRCDAGGRPFILEVNPNPDLSADAGFARSAAAHGWSHDDLIERLALWALERSTRVGDDLAARPALG